MRNKKKTWYRIKGAGGGEALKKLWIAGGTTVLGGKGDNPTRNGRRGTAKKPRLKAHVDGRKSHFGVSKRKPQERKDRSSENGRESPNRQEGRRARRRGDGNVAPQKLDKGRIIHGFFAENGPGLRGGERTILQEERERKAKETNGGGGMGIMGRRNPVGYHGSKSKRCLTPRATGETGCSPKTPPWPPQKGKPWNNKTSTLGLSGRKARLRGAKHWGAVVGTGDTGTET